MKKLFFIPIFCWSLSAQSQELPLKTQEQLEDIAFNTGDETNDDDQRLQQLNFFKKHPLDLNTASKEDLQQFQLLTTIQVENFTRYRELLGKLIGIYELQAIPGWDIVTIRKILPYVYVGPAVSVKDNFFSRLQGDHNILFRWARVLEKSKGYNLDSGNRYLGDPNHLLFRYRYQYRDLLYFGMVGDKDAGEQFSRGSSKGFDFYSLHFFVKKLGIIKALALGDFAVNLGQGLIQWHSSGFIKNSEATDIKKQSPVLMPYRTTGEFSFYRGIGITIQKKRWEITGFVSHKKISGNINDSTGYFSSIQTSGYYRTPSEIADRYRVKDLTSGGVIIYSTGTFKIAMNAVYHDFDKKMKKTEAPYNVFALSGSKFLNSGVDHSYTYRNVHIFGELAIDRNKRPAFLEGLIMSVDPKVDLSFLYRNIDKAYQSLNARAFTENSSPVNENGIYTGVTIRPVYGWTINAFADMYSFPWLRYRVDAPSKGVDYLFHLYYQPSRQTEVFVRWRSESKPLNGSSGKNNSYPVPVDKRSLRLHFGSQLNATVLFRSRIEMVWVGRGSNKDEGFLGYIETIKKFGKKVKAGARFQYVETGSYDSRMYVYESDVLYGFAIPAFYGKGLRYYINVNYDIIKRLNCSLRFSRWDDKTKGDIGSGINLIRINHQTELKAQLAWIL